MNDDDIEFPVLFIGRLGHMDVAESSDSLGVCDERWLKKGIYDGMLILDSRGRCRRVRRVSGAILVRKERVLLFAHRIVKVDLELEDCGAISLDEIKARILEIVEKGDDHWDEVFGVDDARRSIAKAQTAADIIKLFTQDAEQVDIT